MGEAAARYCSLEDKVLQRAVVAVLNAIYEEDFLGFRMDSTRSAVSTTP